MLKATEKIWHNGRFINWNDAKIHVLAHVTSYGSSVFEGVRCYATAAGPRDLPRPRARAPLARFRQDLSHGHSAFDRSSCSRRDDRASCASNKLDSCYIRPLVIRGYGDVGVLPSKDMPIETYMACWEWGKYLGDEAMEQGVDVCVSSWTRLAPNTLPAMSKAGANYMNSQLIRMEAAINGYAEGIALDAAGYVSEGSGENMFVVRDGKIHTPPLGASVLPGHHARHRDSAGAGAGHSRCGNAGAARNAVHRRRSVLHAARRPKSRRSARSIASPIGAGKRGPDHREDSRTNSSRSSKARSRIARMADAGGATGGRAIGRQVMPVGPMTGMGQPTRGAFLGCRGRPAPRNAVGAESENSAREPARGHLPRD